MINNYIRLGYTTNRDFIFFDSNDPISVEKALNRLQTLRKLNVKGPQAIWIPHQKFQGLSPIGK